MSSALLRLLAIIFGLLAIFTIVGVILRLTVKGDSGRAVIANMNARIVAWWIMAGIIAGALLGGFAATIILFAVISLLALREFITLTPTHRGDHRALFWIFFVVTPIQYLLIWRDWYGMFAILIPVYAFLFLPLRIAAAGDTTRFLERTAKIQWGTMVCVYGMSHAPALLLLEFKGYEERGAFLVVYLVLVVGCSQVVQEYASRRLRRRPVARQISRSFSWRTWGLGALAGALVDGLLYWITPFKPPQAVLIGFIAAGCGTLGELVMKALKRDAGVRRWGNRRSVTGAVGLLDRVAPICFAAPVFFHSVRWYFGA